MNAKLKLEFKRALEWAFAQASSISHLDSSDGFTVDGRHPVIVLSNAI